MFHQTATTLVCFSAVQATYRSNLLTKAAAGGSFSHIRGRGDIEALIPSRRVSE
jgi:hypothetical protein